MESNQIKSNQQVDWFERSFEENKELGLNDMNTEDFETLPEGYVRPPVASGEEAGAGGGGRVAPHPPSGRHGPPNGVHEWAGGGGQYRHRWRGGLSHDDNMMMAMADIRTTLFLRGGCDWRVRFCLRWVGGGGASARGAKTDGAFVSALVG